MKRCVKFRIYASASIERFVFNSSTLYHVNENARIKSDPGIEIFTPPVPFRWISRSLSVNGG